jgi:NitT/TauT family transport system substrate-binding protein
MAQGYNIPASDALAMFGDAHNTNWAENYQFFLNQNNPANFERTWTQAYYLYRKIGEAQSKVPFEQVVDFSHVKKLAKEDKYAQQKNEYEIQFTPMSADTIQAESDEILTKTVVIHFFPNSWELDKTIVKTVDGKEKQVPYDPNAMFVIEEVGTLAGQYGASRIVIEGHTDASMKGKVPDQAVIDLSQNRANLV